SQPGTPLPSPTELDRRFAKNAPIWSLNGGASNGFSGRPLFSVRRGTPVVLAITNRTHWSQVLTVRGHVFRLLHPLDDGWEPYFLDTVHLPDNSVSRIAFDAVNPGRWAIRSTIAEHYDAGVYTWFEVA
ncbi:MAG TPA: multicopper oxidase domain-containing protein, partial [Beijerinckiaceae bacterium]|nr:multicopper oxidase domain-containing protein [Beijerinckiaceae bacterium]